MTVDVSGISGAQARVAQIQSLFGTPAAGTATAAAGPAGTSSSFDAAMNRAKTGTSGQQTATTTKAPAARSTASAFERTAQVPAAPAAKSRAASSTASTSSASGANANADAVLATAKKYLGIPYKWGGTNPNVGLDCSGFVQLVMKQHGISLPRVSRDQARQGTKVDSLAEARPGDLVAFGSPVHHIGIYVGDGKMIHAPRTGDVVKISAVHKNMTAIRRVLPDAPAVAPQAAPASTASTPSPATATANAFAASVAGTATPTPAGGIADPATSTSTMTLASALRAAALSPAVALQDGTPAPDTWDAAVAGALAQMPSADGGLGVTPEAVAAVAGLGSAAPASTATVAGGAALSAAPARFRELFEQAERKYGVSANLLAAVAKQESDFTPTAVSHAGARGLMQLMPGTARGLGVKDSFDPAQAVDGAARLLRSHLRTFGSTELALAAYNAGAGAVRKYDGIPPYRETQNYVRKIMANIGSAA